MKLSGLFIALLLFLLPSAVSGNQSDRIVIDSSTGLPLSKASVFDRRGRLLGVCSDEGVLPVVSATDYPVTVRYMGYDPVTVYRDAKGPVVMTESVYELPELLVGPDKNRQVLHMTGYVREYSTKTTYTDTVMLFREKTVDFMIPSKDVKRFKGWRVPRVLASRSCYRFLDDNGMDSVSDRFGQHFSWSDWIGLVNRVRMPLKVQQNDVVTDTVMGRYSPVSVWRRNGEHLQLDIDVLADSTGKKWVPYLSSYIRSDLEFTRFIVNYTFDEVSGPVLFAENVSRISFTIETNGRGRSLFNVMAMDESFDVSTYAEVYITGKEYLTVSEARKWDEHPPRGEEIAIRAPSDAPELQPSVKMLVNRVEAIDHDRQHLGVKPDERLVGIKDYGKKKKKKSRILNLLETIVH